MTPRRIMMYTQDSYGLGHLRRATNLANSIVQQRDDVSVLLVVDSPVAPFFELQDHIDFVKLPTVVKVDAGVFESSSLPLDYERLRALRSNVLRTVVRQYKPDLLLVDHMPGGANRELLPTLRMIRRNRYPVRLVLGLRDIIDDPTVTRKLWQKEGVYRTMERFYDRLLIYGMAEMFPTAETYAIPKALFDRIHYCGYVCNMEAIKAPDRIRTKLDLGDEPLVAVMAGGGADAYRLMKVFLDAVEILNRTERFAKLMVTGPFMPVRDRRTLRDRAALLGVIIHSTLSDVPSYINAADVIVTMAGYNSLTEVMRFQKPTIVVPRAGPSAEQTLRADLFAQWDQVYRLDAGSLDGPRLARALQHGLSLSGTNPSSQLSSLGGVVNATKLLLRFLETPRRRPPKIQLDQRR